MRKLWDMLALFVALIFSIIHWFKWLGTTTYEITGIIDVGLIWIIGMAIICIFPKFLGWILEYFDVVLDKELKEAK